MKISKYRKEIYKMSKHTNALTDKLNHVDSMLYEEYCVRLTYSDGAEVPTELTIACKDMSLYVTLEKGVVLREEILRILDLDPTIVALPLGRKLPKEPWTDEFDSLATRILDAMFSYQGGSLALSNYLINTELRRFIQQEVIKAFKEGYSKAKYETNTTTKQSA